MQTKASEFNDKTILITGGAGFIGSNLAIFLQAEAPDSVIIIFDKFRTDDSGKDLICHSLGHYQNLTEFYGHVICGDITKQCDLELLNQYKFDFIFHQAAISDTRMYDQELLLRTNVNSFEYFLGKAKNDNATLVYASSAATYGSLPAPQNEGVTCPENVYGYSKRVMDDMAFKFCQLNPAVRIVGLRYFNVYGPREQFKGRSSSMILQLAQQILEGKNPKLFIGSDSIFRDFVHINDVVSANLLASHCVHNGVYNVGTGKSRSFTDIVDILQGELGTKLPVDYIPNPYKGYQYDTRACTKTAYKFLQYKSALSLEEGIADFIPYILKMHKTD